MSTMQSDPLYQSLLARERELRQQDISADPLYRELLQRELTLRIERKAAEIQSDPAMLAMWRAQYPTFRGSDEELSRIIAEREVFPGGVMREASPGPTGAAGFARGFGQAFAQTLSPLSPRLAEASADLMMQQPGEGVGGLLGSAAGSVAAAVPTMLAGGPAGPVLTGALFGGGAASEKIDQLADGGAGTAKQVLGGLGAAAAEGVPEMVGQAVLMRLARPVGAMLDQAMGRVAAQGGVSAARAAGAAAGGAAAEGAEEVATLVASNALDVSLGLKTREQAINDIIQQAGPTFLAGTFAGGLIEVPAAAMAMLGRSVPGTEALEGGAADVPLPGGMPEPAQAPAVQQVQPPPAPDQQVRDQDPEAGMAATPVHDVESTAPPVPERPETVRAQVDAVADGRRRAMLVTPGETMPVVPKGLRQLPTPVGTFIYNPQRIKPGQIQAAVKEDRIGDVLDYGISRKPDESEAVGVVTARDADGTEVQAVVTDAASLPAVVESARRVAPDGGTVAVEPPEAVIAGRVAGQETTSPAEAGLSRVSERVAPDAPPAPPRTVGQTGTPGAVTPAESGGARANVPERPRAVNPELAELARWRLSHRSGRPNQVKRFNQEFEQRIAALAEQMGRDPAVVRTDVNRAVAELQRRGREVQTREFEREQEHARRVEEAMETIDATLRRGGFELEFTSESGSRYYRRGDETVRVSDHLVPQTEERNFRAAERGFEPQWTHELVLDNHRNLLASVADAERIAETGKVASDVPRGTRTEPAVQSVTPDVTARDTGRNESPDSIDLVTAPYAEIRKEAQRLGVFTTGPRSRPALVERIREARGTVEAVTADKGAGRSTPEPQPRERPGGNVYYHSPAKTGQSLTSPRAGEPMWVSEDPAYQGGAFKGGPVQQVRFTPRKMAYLDQEGGYTAAEAREQIESLFPSVTEEELDAIIDDRLFSSSARYDIPHMVWETGEEGANAKLAEVARREGYDSIRFLEPAEGDANYAGRQSGRRIGVVLITDQSDASFDQPAPSNGGQAGDPSATGAATAQQTTPATEGSSTGSARSAQQERSDGVEPAQVGGGGVGDVPRGTGAEPVASVSSVGAGSPVPRTLEERLTAIQRRAAENLKGWLEANRTTLRSGLTTADFKAVKDIAVWIAAAAAKAGIVGGRKLMRFVQERTAHLRLPRDKADQVGRIVRGILKDARRDDGSIDPDRFEEAVAAVQSVAGRRGQRPAKTAANAAAGVTKPDRKVSERAALRGKLRFGERAARDADRAARREERAAAKARLGKLQEQARAKADTADAIRAEAVRLLEENVPRAIRGKYLTAVRDAATLPRLAAMLRRVHRDLVTAEARGVLKAARRVGKRDLGKLEPELREAADAALGAIQRASEALAPSKPGGPPKRLLSIAELETIRAELVAALNTLKGVLHEQKNLDTVRIKGEVIEAATLRDELLGRVQEREELPAPERGAPEPAWIKRFLRRRTNWESIMRGLDGFKPGGPAQRLFDQVLRARREALRLSYEFQDGLSEIVRRHGYDSVGRFQAELSGTLGRALQKTVDVTVGGRKLSLGEAAYLYAASTDEGFKLRIATGQRMQFRDDPLGEPFMVTDRDLERVAAALPENVRAIVDESKALYDAHFFDRLSAVNKRLKGYHLEKVAGYWGIKLNRRYSEGRGTPQSWRRVMIRAMEEAGFTQERVGPSKTPMLLGDFGTDITRRAAAASTVIAKAETVKLLTRVLLHPDVMTAVRARFGEQFVERIERRISLFSGGDLFAEPNSAWLRRIQSMWARGKTQLWVPTWARNAVAGSMRLLNELEPGDVARAWAPRPTWQEFQELKRYSPELRERWEGHSLSAFYDPSLERGAEARFKQAMGATLLQLRDMVAASARLSPREVGEAIKEGGKAWRALLDSFSIGNYFDAVPAIIAYRVFLGKAPPNLDAEARKKWAARHATRVFERVSNTATIEYANDVQLDAREDFTIQMFIPFTADTAKAQNMLYEAHHRGSDARLRAVTAIALSSAMSALISAAWSALTGEDREKVARSGMARMAQELAGLAPGLGPIAAKLADWAVRGSGSKSVPLPEVELPILELINKGMSAASDAIEGVRRLNEPRRKRVLTSADLFMRSAAKVGEAVGESLGLPMHYLRTLRRSIENWSGD